MLHDVVVVGAGAAGIAAARTLREQGIEPLVIEARERTGGRAWTDTTSLGVPVDMGCAWLHSADRNPWTAYAREVGFAVIERPPVWQRRIGRQEPPPDYVRSWHAAFERNERLIDATAKSGRDLPVSEVVPVDRHRPTFDAIMGWLMGVDSEKVSCVDYARYQDSEVNWSVPMGLGALVSHATEAFVVRLATPVRALDHRGRRVRIETDRGTIEARAVIVTIPTSLLSRGDVRFLPELPLGFQEAFSGIPLGSPNKVFFRMAPGTMPFAGTTHFIGTADDKCTASYETRAAGQDVLMAFFGGSLSLELEQREQLESFAREELSKIFGASFNSQLIAAVSTGWSQDPWSRGSYSAALPGCAHMRERMREPLDEKVFFAGEACSSDYFGTLIGASQTGVAAAKQVAAIISPR